VAQARRNEQLAQQLLTDLQYKEWIVIACFYSALHYVEAALSQNSAIEHSETSFPRDYPGGIHDYRQDLVEQYYPVIFSAYSKLRNNSMIARYLSIRKTPIGMPVEEFFGDEAVKNFVGQDLDKVRRKLGY